MKSRLLPVLTIGAFLLIAGKPLQATEQSLDLSKAKTKVEFLAVGRPSMLKIRGTTQEEDKSLVTGSLALKGNSLSGAADFPLDSLDTGISLRNRHMKEKYLETAKYPKAELSLTELKLPESVAKGDGSAKDVPFKANLKVHGESREVSGTVAVERKGNQVNLDFEFSTKIPDHKIPVPSFMGVTVAEEVKIFVKVDGALSERALASETKSSKNG